MSREVDIKVDRAARIAWETGAAGVLLSAQRNFAWITGGGSNSIDGSREAGAGALLVTADGRRFVVANAIEMARLVEEPLAGLGFVPVEYPWTQEQADPATIVDRARSVLTRSAPLATDLALSPDTTVVEHALMRARMTFVAAEVERLRALGRDMGVAAGTVCRSLRPGTSERQIAGIVAAAIHAAGARPVVVLVGADDRIARFRHPVATDAIWRKTLMVVVCAERHGLVVALTRMVSSGSIDPILRDRTHATACVFARLLAQTEPGASGARLFEVAARAYADAGFAGEEQKHHQGGAIGYRSREWIAHPASQEVAMARQAFAWNPSITGSKIEETVLLVNGGLEVITATPGWPNIEFVLRDQRVAAPDVLVI